MLSRFRTRNVYSPLDTGRRKQLARTIFDARGFTLIELLVVVVLVGITSAMFATVYGTTVDRSSEVQAQNIAQTEVRAALNGLVSDLRNATTGSTAAPILPGYTTNSIAFYTPDRRPSSNPSIAVNLLKVRYWLTTDNRLQRQATPVIAYDSNENPIDPGDTGPVQFIATVKAPATGTVGAGGWAQGAIFQYCRQSPPNMTIDPTNTTSPELITWKCETPASAALVKTIVIRAVVSANGRSSQYNYGAVATLRWNVS